MRYGSPRGLPDSTIDFRQRRPPGKGRHGMTRFLISFDARAMDHIPHEDMPAVSEAAHAVVREAMDAGAWVFGGGLEHQKPSIVAMTERPRTARTPGRRRTLRRRRILTRGR